MRAIIIAGIAIALAGCGRETVTSTPVDVPALATTAASADPALAIIPETGDIVLAWIGGEGDVWTLYTARSSDGGESWSDAVPVAGGPSAPNEVHPHGESAPRLVAGPDGMLALAWPNSVVVPGRKWPAAMMRFSRSTDGGRSWSAPITLNDDTTGAPTSHQFHGAEWSKEAGLVVAWLDERGRTADSPSDATIYLASSPDFGASWEPNRAAWGEVCPCCRVALARQPDGAIVAAWRKHFPGDVRDVVIAPIAPAVGTPARVYKDDWVYPGCPHTGPALAARTHGGAHVAWYTGKADDGGAGVYYSRLGASGEPEHRVALVTGPALPPAHASVAALDDGGALVAYDLGDAKGTRALTVVRIAPDGDAAARLTVPGSAEAKYPQLIVLSSGKALLAWTASEGERPKVRVVRLDLGTVRAAS